MVELKWPLAVSSRNTSDEAVPKGNLSKTILVPFPVESALSGVQEHHERMLYRRTFIVPKEWKGQRILQQLRVGVHQDSQWFQLAMQQKKLYYQ